MLRTDGVKRQLSGQFEANRGERPLLSPLSPKAQVALMLRRLSREHWNEHMPGTPPADGTVLTNSWELSWGERRSSDIITTNEEGMVLGSKWNTRPTMGLNMQIHKLRPEINVVIHDHGRQGPQTDASARDSFI
jgi:L-fuculose-phosphate aldolase